jgi:hypothetical protein
MDKSSLSRYSSECIVAFFFNATATFLLCTYISYTVNGITVQDGDGPSKQWQYTKELLSEHVQ